MSISELITPFHLGRKALIYIRQSNPHQVLTNQESQRLQYALQQRARECGWAEDAIEVIDTDLGRTASTTQGRQGFKEIVARVTLDQVGIIFSYDVTRCHAIAPTGIRCSTCAVTAAASSATGTGSMTRPRSTAAFCSG